MALSLRRTTNRAREFILTRTYSFDRLNRYLRQLVLFVYRFSALRLSSFCIHLIYFVFLALLGSLIMVLLKPSDPSFSPSYVDMLFMSTSALTVSGLGTVETERLSSAQIAVLTLLMFVGGEVFVTLLGLLLRRTSEHDKREASAVGVDAVRSELEPVASSRVVTIDSIEPVDGSAAMAEEKDLRLSCVRWLRYIVSSYIFTFHLFGTSLLLIYIYRVSNARDILRKKGINVFLFSLSTTVSSFANGGLIATNENMAAFNRNPTMLLLMIAQVLAGNLLFPLFLRLVIWTLKKITKREEFRHMLKSTSETRFSPLLPEKQTCFLSLTVVGLMTALLVLFCSMDWDGAVFDGLTSFEKIVSAFFIAANSRHAGENSIDPSLISPAVLVFIIVMMYLPPSATFWPAEEDDTSSDGIKKQNKKKKSWVQNLLLSQLSCIIIYIILICIIERRKMRRDPLNFSSLNMIFEVTSAYGNVGLSTGYSCSRLMKLHPEASCQDKPYSLAGFWSDESKILLSSVMLYGRLKKFSAQDGKAWRLY
ncbi:cation transporter HKT2;2 [Musa acuminata AAA Group]|uniref:cation transporter HKT2;2 n=1 Tax=Musa acuminata AAA Group TaxID=214697 RepID=UPI0031CE5ACD